MSIINNEKNYKTVHSNVFLKVCKYCFPHMLIIATIPFIFVLISLLFRLFGAINIAESIAMYMAFPIALISPMISTVKIIYALKGAFPRKTDDSHKVVLSVFFCYAVCTLITIILFNISCSIYRAYPLDFPSAAYMRDMFTSSPSAMMLFYFTVFCLYITISLMAVTAYFIGYKKKTKHSFSISCLVFILMYVIVLVAFILAYFAATFMDIIALESIQISSSIFNSSMLCAFLTFLFTSFLLSPIIYCINIKTLKSLQ